MLNIVLEGADKFKKEMDAVSKQVPFATALALTRTAQISNKAIQSEMARVFDRPTRWTLRSLRVFPAKKNNLTARIDMKNEADKSSPATRWLGPQVFSGERKDKASERNLRHRHLLPRNKQTAFGKNAKLDKHGNLPRGQVLKALSGVGGFQEAGYSANATDSVRSTRKGNRKQYFLMRKGRDAIGIGRRTSKKNMHVLIAFVRKPTYQQRLDFYGIGQRAASKALPEEMSKALDHAIATARK